MRKARPRVKPLRPESSGRREELRKIAEKFSMWGKPSEVLTPIRAVPTIFPAIDVAIGEEGGLPLERFFLTHGPSSGGKALSTDCPVLTPGGWRTMGELIVGDEVIGGDGSPCRVVGVYPQGKKHLFKVSFNDGAVVECCAEHLWFTTTTNERLKGRYIRGPRPRRVRIPTGVDGKGSVKSLDEIRARFVQGEHSIPLCGVVKYRVAGKLPLNPYLLGLLLGDGSFTQGTIQFSKPEDDLHSRIAALLPEGDALHLSDDERGRSIIVKVGREKNGRPSTTASLLARLGLIGKRSWEKFVPEEYLLADSVDRLALLQGLLDSDGHVRRGKSVEFTSTSRALVAAVRDLTRSLGGIATVARERRTKFSYNGETRLGRPSTRTTIRFPNSSVTPVSSKKNLSKWIGKVDPEYRTISSIRYSRSGEAVCIAVDSPDRTYVIDGFVVTHNTQLLIGVGLSFLQAGHAFALLEPEITTTVDWTRELMGDYVDHPLFFAQRPGNYEEAISATRELCNKIADLREKKKLPAGTGALVGCDSISQLVPKDLLAKMLSEVGEHGVDGLKGASGRAAAAMNTIWCRELTGLLYRTGCSFMAITREREAQDKRGGRGPAYKVSGGTDLRYSATLEFRSKKSYPFETKVGGKIVGARFAVQILKTKLADGTVQKSEGFFHVANGSDGTPRGFDRARDVWALSGELGVVKKFKRKDSVGWETFDGEILSKDEEENVRTIRSNDLFRKALEDECRRRGMEQKGKSDEPGKDDDVPE